MDSTKKEAWPRDSGQPYFANREISSTRSQDEIRQHVLETFGSEAKALHWLQRPNPLFAGKTPAEALESEPDIVEDELVRIDQGIFI